MAEWGEGSGLTTARESTSRARSPAPLLAYHTCSAVSRILLPLIVTRWIEQAKRFTKHSR